LLLEKHADVNKRDRLGRTALMFAVRHDELSDLKIAELLLKNNAVIDERDEYGRTALMFAAEHGRLRMVEFLLGRGADVAIKNKEGKTALEIAKEHGKTEIVKAIKDFFIRKQKVLMEVEEELPEDLAELITDFETGGLK